MTPIEVVAEFRSQVADEAQPNLWSDDEVFLYLVDAQDMLVRAMGGIADVTVAAADVGSGATLRLQDIALTDGAPYTAHSPYILRIRSGRLMTAARDVTFIQESDLPQMVTQDYGWQVGLKLNDTEEGPVTHGVLGIKEKNIRWVKVPDVADTCRLNVFRLPYPRMADLDGPVVLEVDEQHHRHLILWMKHLAYSKQDAETRDDKRAAEFENKFNAYADKAYRELQRARYRTRQVQYGGL